MLQSKALFNDDLTLSQDFTQHLKNSKNPILLTFFGILRAGKSTRANQIITGELEPSGPFEADDGSESITQGCNYCGPFKINQILPNHDVHPKLNKDADIFIIDCEGLHDIKGQRSGNVKKMTTLLLQISTLITYVSKDVINTINIPEIRNFLGISKIIPGGGIQYETGFIIMVRTMGIKGSKDMSEEELNTQRKNQDKKVKDNVIKILNQENVIYNENNFQVLCQPDFTQTSVYFESLKDYLHFIVSIVNMRDEIPGTILLQVLENVRPIINQLTDLDNPNINSTDIYNKVIEGLIEKAMVDVNHEINEIPAYIKKQIIENFDNFNKNSYSENMCARTREIFTRNCINQLKKIESFTLFKKKQVMIQEMVQKKINESYQEYYKEQGFSYIIDKIRKEHSKYIVDVLGKLMGSELRNIKRDKKNWGNQYSEKAGSTFEKTVSKGCDELLKTRIFEQSKNSLKKDIWDISNEKLKLRCKECPPFPKTVSEARKSGQIGNVVELWKDKNHSHKWTVNDKDEVIIQVTATKYSKMYEYTCEGINDSTCSGRSKVGNVKSSFDVDSMTLHIYGGDICSSQSRYKHGMGRGHYTAHVEYIEIVISESDLIFGDGSKTQIIKADDPGYKNYPYHGSKNGNRSYILTLK
ncbi:hypothetical protein TRFO_04553 [Tritrichomonas foetus]|uniref:Uncharacterized protein n=1 Tax=Tritrichomonas foetus TaxID=1144522 RepID=A0A1J4KEV7_9EUKA|nr:hypothetical protein TRFO_04553 [Tritrichomonas foetus]|eukprot:OHT09472.1 hypothetical protein TRFO_04553 [Tritrichomonas foetus]